MLHKLLNVRHRRLRRLSRALIRHLRTEGLDEKGTLLRNRLWSALARFNDVHYHPELSNTEKTRINRVRLSLIGMQDQIEATISTRMSEPVK